MSTFATARELLTAKGFDDPKALEDTSFGTAVFEAAREVADADEKLREAIAWLRNDLDRTERDLDEGGTINSLGVVQSKGLDVDRLCALRQEKREQFNRLVWLYQNH